MNDKVEKYVVGIGEVLVDCFKRGKKEIKKLGGAPTIFAYHAAQTGCIGMIVSAVSDDSDGQFIKAELKRLKIRDSVEVIKGKRSGIVEVDDKDPNDPQYTIIRDLAWSSIPNRERLVKIAENTEAVYFGSLASFESDSKTTIDTFIDAVPDDSFKIFDVNLRYDGDKPLFNERLILEYIDKSNVLKVNLQELDYICAISSINIKGNDMKRCKDLIKKFPKLRFLIVTMGADGSTILWRDVKTKEIAFSSLGMPVEVKNTVGAGDALAGTFIGEVLKGKPIVSAHHAAVLRSTLVCEAEESMPPIIQTDIFISYSRKDSEVVNDVFCKYFAKKKWTVWIDEKGIKHGERFTAKIKHAIRNSCVVVYFSSKNANRSRYVTQEIAYASNNGKPIIPIMLDDAPFNKDVRSVLESLDHMDYSKLVTAIESNLNY